jgi:hypothetical protein
MLRGNPEPPRTAAPPRPDRASAGEDTDLPGLDRPYATGDRPPGVLFYCAKHSFWRPYHLLQEMEFATEQLTLGFATEDIVIRGRSLHPLYVALASQTVCRLVEQGERYAALSETGPCITGIERRPHQND